MTTSRRTVLSVLGLAPTLPIAAADFGNQLKGGRGLHFGNGDVKKMAAALRALAAEVESGGAFVDAFDLTSTMRKEAFALHSMRLDFYMRENTDDDGSSRNVG